MPRRRFALRLFVPLVAIATAASLALPAGATPKSTNSTPTAAGVLGSGSDTTFHMMNQLDAFYLETPGCQSFVTTGTQPLDFSCILPDPPGTITTENYKHDQVHEAYFLGSSAGINQLCQQGLAGVAHIDFARSSRAPGVSDCSGTHFVAYARDGIPWVAFPGVNGSHSATMNNQSTTCAGSSGYCLSQQNMKDIFVNCTVTDWSQIGGTAGTIQVYAANPASGTKKTMDTFLGGDSDHCASLQDPSHIVEENQNTNIIQNGDAPSAISYFSWGVYQAQVVPHPDGSELGAVDSVFATKTTIQNGTFPYGRFLYNVYCTASCATGPSSAETVTYVGETGWICKLSNQHAVDAKTGKNYQKEIASIISDSGFVPLAKGPIGGGVSGQDYCRLTVH